MCKYCDIITKSGYANVELESSDDTALRMSQASEKVYLIAESFEDCIESEIKYCPFCGRKF